jgi:transcriptional regulator with XRE-family HTH domain
MLKVKVKANDIERLLAKRNLSQNAFAERLGISSGYMSQLMRGTRYPSAELRAKIISSLKNINFDKIFVIVDDGELKS